MADKMRWRYGETNPIICTAFTGLIEIGDLVYYDASVAKPASEFAISGTLASTQASFSAKFLGVAMQRSPEGDTTPIRIATTGVFEFDGISPSTYALGTMVSAPNNSATSKLHRNYLGMTTSGLGAIGRIVREEPVSTSNLLVMIVSTVIQGGIRGTSYNPV